MLETASSLVEAPTSLVLHITRLFDAPRELVYQAFTDPAMLSHWMGPRGFTPMDIQHDVRPGGKWRLRLHKSAEVTACEPNGQTDLWQHGAYLEVVPPERLVYTFAWDGRTDMLPFETTITVTFRDMEGKTVMDFKQGTFNTVEDRDGHNVGWSSAFDRFAEFLLAPVGQVEEVTHDLFIERVFDAPRELVWKAWTDPAMAAQWSGPRGFEARDIQWDARPGGQWRMRLHSDGFDVGDGQPRVLDLWQGGVFREITPPQRLVYTFAWENRACVGLDPEPHETLITVEFKQQGSQTVMTFLQQFFTSIQERDGHSKGWNSTFDRLAELVVALKARTV